MKKIFSLSLLFISINGFSQNSYYDALTLSKYVVNGKLKTDSASKEKVCKILNNYLESPYAVFDANTIADEYTDSTGKNYNPFLEKYFPVNGMGASFLPFTKSAGGLLSSVGGLNVTNFADGLAKFLIKRFKEELSITFFQKFKEEISKPAYEDLRILFSQTYKVLLVADKDIYNFSTYINTLREAFIKDLTNMYKSFKKVKDLPKYQSYFAAHVELNTLVLNAFYFIDQFTNAVHPGDVIANYDPDHLINLPAANINLQTNLRSSIKVLKVCSNSLKSVSADNYWVPADSVRMLLADPVTRDLFFGLIYQLADDKMAFVTRSGSMTFRNILARAKRTGNEIDQFKERIETIISYAQEVNEYITSVKEKKKSEVDYNDYYRLFNASLDILDEGFTLVNLPTFNIDASLQNEIDNKVSRLLNIARNSVELYIDVRTKNYSSAVLNTISLIDSIFENSYDGKLRSAILKYGNFAASIAAAQNSDEVEKAIEAVVLPAGSSRIKRESPVNISANAYVGGIGGWEYLPTLKEKQTSAAVGFTAQVGIAFSIGNLMKGANRNSGGKSITLFIPVIDVGALASFRLQNDSSKVASEVQLKNIFAPGLFVYYGLGKCPVSIGAGVQIGPQLRQVTAKDINIEKNYYVRYGISVCVDIPLLNLYTKSK